MLLTIHLVLPFGMWCVRRPGVGFVEVRGFMGTGLDFSEGDDGVAAGVECWAGNLRTVFGWGWAFLEFGALAVGF